jgi:ABC-2 type transport system permease protein
MTDSVTTGAGAAVFGTLAQVWAASRYEFRMQIRKWSLWLSAAVLAVLIAVTQGGPRGPRYLPAEATPEQVMAAWTLLFSLMMPIAFGMVLADRLVRDYRLGVASLLASLPPGRGTLLAGKYAGGVAATAVPGLLAVLLAATGEFADRGDPALFPAALEAFALIMLPGLAFVAAYAMVCPMVLTAPLFRVLFVCYWFWGNMLAPSFLPTLSGSLLTPIGDYPASWLVGERALFAGMEGWLSVLRPAPSGAATAASIALLVALGLLPLIAAGPPLMRRRAAS